MIREQLSDAERLVDSARVQVQAVQRLDTEPVELDEEAANAVEQATARYGVAMQEYLELAIRSGEEWFDAVHLEISRCRK